jgi:transposase
MICFTYNVCRQTVSTWFYKWKKDGLYGLVDRSGRGRNGLTETQKEEVIKQVEKSPRSLKKVLLDFEKKFGFSISIDIIKSICKKAGLVWKRVRKSLKNKRNQAKFDESKTEIEALIQQHKDNEIDLCYFDESGFTLEPCVPYA